MFKLAQLRILDPNKIFVFQKDRKGRFFADDESFRESFLPDFAKVHVALNKGLSLKAAASPVTSLRYRLAMIEIINQVGEEKFKNSAWNEILDMLNFYRESPSAPPEKSEPSPQEIVEPKIETTKEEVKTEPETKPTSKEIKTIPSAKLTDEQSKKIEEYKAKEYPKDIVIQKNIKVTFDNIISYFEKLNQKDLEENLINYYDDLVTGAFEVLDEYHESLSKTEEPKETEPKETEPKETEPKQTESKEKVKDEKSKKRDDFEERDESGLKKKFPSVLTIDEALALTNLDLSANYFSVENGELSINYPKFTEAYTQASNLLLTWADKALKSSKTQERFIKPTPNIIQEINNIVFGIRSFDYSIYSKFEEFIFEIDQAIIKSPTKEYTNKLIDLRKYLNEQLINKLKSVLISTKLSQDSVLAEKIADAILYSSSFSAFLNYHLTSEKFIDNPNNEFLNEEVKKDFEASHKFVERLQLRTINGISSKFRSFWRSERVEIDPEKSRDLIAFMNTSANEFLIGARYDISSLRHGIKQFQATTCPSCHRVIEFHSGIKEVKDDYYSGYIIANIAPYKDNKNGTYTFFTEDYLRYQDGNMMIHYPPPSKEYFNYIDNSYETIQIINNFDNKSYTWDEINQMINSDDYFIQREGIIRRSEALRLAGGIYLGNRNINKLRYFCPMGLFKTKGDTNICGASFEEPKGDRPYNLQVQWNKELPKIQSFDGNTKKVYENNFFEPKNWKNENLANIAKAKSHGGYKFSRITFGCPCHIDKESIDPTDTSTYLKYGHLAFPITKDEQYYPPTSADGQYKSLDEKTMGYLICGSNVSLSSVDRDPSSSTYFLKYLSSLMKKDSQQFINLVNFLIRQGFDELELVQMFSDLENLSEAKNASDNAKRQQRLNKLEDILIKNAVMIEGAIFEAIKDLTLVCPFGHKFTIEQSIKFGNSHGTIKLTNSKSYSANINLILSSGELNFNEFRKYLVPISMFSKFRKFAYYNDWLKIPTNNRRINLFRSKITEVEKVMLKININGEDFGFSDDFELKQDLIWSGNTSRTPEKDSIGRQVYGLGGRTVSMDALTEGTKDLSGTSLSYVSESEAETEWERVMSQILDYNLSEENHPYSPPIPGGVSHLDYEREWDLALNMSSLNRSMIATLKIIKTWTANLIDDKFAESLTRQFLEDDKIKSIGDKIFDLHVKEQISFESLSEEDTETEDVAKALELYKNFFTEIFLNASQILALIREGALGKRETAQKIISTTLSNFFARYEEVNVENVIADLSSLDINKVTEDILSNKALKEGGTMFREGSPLEEQITIFNPNVTQSEQGLGKLTLVAYAKFLALAVYKMQSLFFTKTSQLYVGYNPLPRVFESVNDVLEVSDADINSIKNSWKVSDILEDPNTVYQSRADISELGPKKYIPLINKAYHFLNMHIENARNLTITPRALASAKDYVTNRLGDKFLADYIEKNPTVSLEDARKSLQSQKERLNSVFSIHSASFEELVGDSEGNLVYCPYNIIPNFSVGKGSKSKTSYNHPFYDELRIDEDQKGRMVLIHPDKNYNSGKIQVGAFTKPTLLSWPLPRYGYQEGHQGSRNHVGVPLPLYDSGGYKSTYSEIRDLGLTGLNLVAEVPYTISEEESIDLKLDISFLLERGYTESHYKMIHNLNSEIEDIKKLKSAEIFRINEISKTHPREISEYQRLISIVEKRIKMNKVKTTDNARRQVTIDEKELEHLKAKIKILEYELENIDALREKADLWYSENIARIQTEYNNLPYSLLTKKSTYHVSDIGLSNLTPGYFINHKKEFEAQSNPAGVVHLGLADPMMAYQLIMTKELHGQNYVNLGEGSVSEELIKDALISFIVGVYGLDEVAKVYANKYRKELVKKGIDLNVFDGRALLEYTVNKTFEDLGTANYDQTIMPGNWYDISLKDSSMGLNATKLAFINSKQRLPTLTSLKEMIIKDPVKSRKSYGITRPYEKSDILNAKTVSSRAAAAMKRYIYTMTSGKFNLDNEASDSLVSKSNYLFEKILKRGESLVRIMMMQADRMIEPTDILEEE